MDFSVHRNPETLVSTGHVEIGPWKYAGHRPGPGSVFVCTCAFALVEGMILRHFPLYDRCGINYLPQASGLAIAAEFRMAARELDSFRANEWSKALAVPARFRARVEKEALQRRDAIQAMLEAIASALEQIYRRESHACIRVS